MALESTFEFIGKRCAQEIDALGALQPSVGEQAFDQAYLHRLGLRPYREIDAERTSCHALSERWLARDSIGAWHFSKSSVQYAN